MKKLTLILFVFTSIMTAQAEEGLWTCDTTYDCGQNGYSYKDYYGRGTGYEKASAQAAAKAEAFNKCSAECSSLARPPYTHPTCHWGMNGSCTQRVAFDLE